MHRRREEDSLFTISSLPPITHTLKVTQTFLSDSGLAQRSELLLVGIRLEMQLIGSPHRLTACRFLHSVAEHVDIVGLIKIDHDS
jgi:hypothetical protein